MIYDELHTPFRWYNSIDKQNRNKSQCAASCDYKLLTPLNKILPFQILTDQTGLVGTITTWKIYCPGDDLYLDLTSEIGSLTQVTAGGRDYIIYNETTDIATIECGCYYSVIEVLLSDASTHTYYSELFCCIDTEEEVGPEYVFPLATAWRYNDRRGKAERYKAHCEKVCNFYLMCGNDALLPFMFRKIAGSNTITSWVLREIDGTCIHVLDYNLYMVSVAVNAYFYYYYLGDALPDLPCGVFESIVTVGGVEFISEPIIISADFSTLTITNYLLTEGIDIINTEGDVGILI